MNLPQTRADFTSVSDHVTDLTNKAGNQGNRFISYPHEQKTSIQTHTRSHIAYKHTHRMTDEHWQKY